MWIDAELICMRKLVLVLERFFVDVLLCKIDSSREGIW